MRRKLALAAAALLAVVSTFAFVTPRTVHADSCQPTHLLQNMVKHFTFGTQNAWIDIWEYGTLNEFDPNHIDCLYIQSEINVGQDYMSSNIVNSMSAYHGQVGGTWTLNFIDQSHPVGPVHYDQTGEDTWFTGGDPYASNVCFDVTDAETSFEDASHTVWSVSDGLLPFVDPVTCPYV